MMHNLLFGIPSLDALFEPVENRGRSAIATSLAILGPDGTGKSVLALHLVSTYAAHTKAYPCILYLSTDLRYDKAEKIWNNFALGRPSQRDIPFERTEEETERKSLTTEVQFNRLRPGPEVESYLDPTNRAKPQVGFLDLASRSAGDDWGYVNRLVALLERNKARPHLIVIDSVPGFETLVGATDAFGESTSRRARIAQIVRAAGENCHVVFIVEEPKEHDHLAEEYVTDTVIRLRKVENRQYTRRTIEIDKARAMTHALGEHPFEIRGRNGSSTGAVKNLDDPDQENAYVQVFHSIHYRDTRITREVVTRIPDPSSDRSSARYAEFGIEFLDNMLAGITHGQRSECRGLPCSSLTSLIGDTGTRKTLLGYAFLFECFRPYREQFREVVEVLSSRSGGKPLRDLLSKILGNPRTIPERCWLDQRPDQFIGQISKRVLAIATGDRFSKWLENAPKRPGKLDPLIVANWLFSHPNMVRPAVLMTTHDMDAPKLAAMFRTWLEGVWEEEELDAATEYMKKHIICRRLPVQDAPTPLLLHIIECAMDKAARDCYGGDPPQREIKRVKSSRRIRLVIDDFRSMRETYLDIRDDPLFLPFLTFYLGHEGVTALIVDTDSGRPDQEPADKLNAELRALVQHQIYTWRVPFYSQNRVAIAAIPTMSKSEEYAGIVRELRLAANMSKGEVRARQGRAGPQDQLTVDPHFELYSGLEEGRPKPVPLEIRLVVETPAFQQYIQEEDILLRELFGGLSDGESVARKGIIRGEGIQRYFAVRDFCNLPTDTRLDHSLVFQVDGSWSLLRTGALANQYSYLCEERVTEPHLAAILDPFRVFQETQHEDTGKKKHRLDFFKGARYKPKVPRNNESMVDRVPYMWDFGFLLCKKYQWEVAAGKEFKVGQGVKSVGEIWNALPKAPTGTRKRGAGKVSWREFMGACQEVARMQSYRLSRFVPPFDVAVCSPDTLSSFILELWISEIYDRVRQRPERPEDRLEWNKWQPPEPIYENPWGPGLIRLLKEPDNRRLGPDYLAASKEGRRPDHLRGYSVELYKAWLLIIDAIDLASFVDPEDPFLFRVDRPAHPDAVASRHWYKTACLACKSTLGGPDKDDAYNSNIPVRLPGHFSMRGDWYLAAAAGSRSQRLARRAIDILSSRRQNIRRLQLGLGLPTRDVMDDKAMKFLETGLVVRPEKGSDLPELVAYPDLLRLAAGGNKEFRWLWRSALSQYDRQAKVWHSWLCSLFRWSHSLRAQYKEEWIPGLSVYDQLQNAPQDILPKLKSFVQFADRCDQLIADLERAGASSRNEVD